MAGNSHRNESNQVRTQDRRETKDKASSMFPTKLPAVGPLFTRRVDKVFNCMLLIMFEHYDTHSDNICFIENINILSQTCNTFFTNIVESFAELAHPTNIHEWSSHPTNINE